VKGSVGQAQWRPFRDGDIEASLAHGVLTVYVPKAESTKSSKITVSESGDGSP
jgi:HSP20 family protein